MNPQLAYYVFHQSSGVGAHMIRVLDPWAFANHTSIVYAPAWCPLEVLLTAPLFEARNKLGVTGVQPNGVWRTGTRTLGQAVDGGDKVEVYQAFEVPEAAERAAYEWLRQQVGKPYDVPGLSGFVPLTLLRKAALEYQERRKGDAAWWCSELDQALSAKRGQPLLDIIQPFQARPEPLRWSPVKAFTWASHSETPSQVAA